MTTMCECVIFLVEHNLTSEERPDHVLGSTSFISSRGVRIGRGIAKTLLSYGMGCVLWTSRYQLLDKTVHLLTDSGTHTLGFTSGRVMVGSSG